MRNLILLSAALALSTISLRAQLAEPPKGVTEGAVAELSGRCASNPDLGNLDATRAWSGWGGENNARFQSKAAAGLAPGEYSVVVGWYAQPTGQRLHTTPERSDRAVPVGTLNIAG